MTGTPSASTVAAPARDLRAAVLRPTLPELWAFLAVALPALAAIVAPMPAVDLAYHLRAGSDILGGAGIPTTDTWTFTAQGLPWADQQWLSQVILAAAYRIGGWTGLVLLRAILVGATFWLLARAIGARRPDLGRRTIALLVLAAFVLAAPGLGLRPQLFGYLLFAATLALVAARGQHPRGVWLIPVIAALWANLHGTFVLVPVVAGLAWLDDLGARAPRRHSMVLVAGVSALATLLNPLGASVWSYAIGLAGNGRIAERVSEWQRTTLADPTGVIFWVSVALVLTFFVYHGVVRRRVVAWPDAVALVAFGALGAWTLRGVGWWGFMAAFVVAGLLPAARMPAREPRRSVANAAVALAIVVAAVALLPAWRAPVSVTGAPSGLLSYAPAGITAELRSTSTARLMPLRTVWTPQVWTSWFEFAAPDKLYAVDSRVELFPARVWDEVDTVAAGGDAALAVLDRYRVEAVVTLASGDDGLAATLLAASTPAVPGMSTWHCSYGDADGRIWLRGAGTPGPGC